MKIILQLCFVLLLALTTVSCEINFESTFHKDTTTSMKVTLKIDEKMEEDMTSGQKEAGEDTPKKFKGYSIAELPSKWTSFYALNKKSGKPLPSLQDSVRFLKSVWAKFDTKGDDLRGFSIKIDRAGKKDLRRFHQLFRDMSLEDGPNRNVTKRTETLEPRWDGKKLVIPVGEDPVAKEISNPEVQKTQAEAKEALKFFTEMLNGANVIVSYTFTFECKIRKIQGTHDLIKKLDDYSVAYRVDMLDIVKKEAKGERIKRADPEIIIWTE
ncbi:MAG: hypothetical protein AAF934_07160 [Bacteroidota bacterium]